jgi:predicted  nucleic acid-binding Zn-ribbon protein
LQTDRRTRDRVRLFFWVVLSIVCLAAVLVARQQQQQGLQRKVDAARERAVRYTQNVLGSRLDAHRVNDPIELSGYDSLLADIEHDLFNDQRVVRVRVWRPDGLLVFTTDDAAKIGVASSDDPGLASALQGNLVTDVRSETFARDGSTTPVPTDLLATFVPLRVSAKADVHGVVEIDNDYTLMRDATSQPWMQMQVAFGIVALLCLVMAILSFVWSHRPEEVAGFGPSRRDVRAVARDERRAGAAQAEAAKLRDRVKELQGETKTAAQQLVELERLRSRVAELEHQPAPSPATVADQAEADQLRARAAQLEEQARGSEVRVTQLQSRVTEMEAQLRVTTEQLRSTQKRAEESTMPPEVQAQLQAASETEALLRAELASARGEAESSEKEREEIVRVHSEEAQAQQGQMDQVRAQARIAEEERQRILAEAAKGSRAAPAMSADAQTHIRELEQLLERSENERAMLRAGRPETVYEARNRELEDEMARMREHLEVSEGRARSADSTRAGVDPTVIAALEERIAAAERRAGEAERRLDETRPRSAARSRALRHGKGAAPAAPAESEEPATEDEPEASQVDGSELRSRLVRSTDARRRGATTTPTPTPGPERRR